MSRGICSQTWISMSKFLDSLAGTMCRMHWHVASRMCRNEFRSEEHQSLLVTLMASSSRKCLVPYSPETRRNTSGRVSTAAHFIWPPATPMELETSTPVASHSVPPALRCTEEQMLVPLLGCCPSTASACSAAGVAGCTLRRTHTWATAQVLCNWPSHPAFLRVSPGTNQSSLSNFNGQMCREGQ